MKKGSFDYKVDGNKIIVCCWLSSRVVSICFNAVGVEPVRLTRYHLGEVKARAQGHRPSLVKLSGEGQRG